MEGFAYFWFNVVTYNNNFATSRMCSNSKQNYFKSEFPPKYICRLAKMSCMHNQDENKFNITKIYTEMRDGWGRVEGNDF